MGEYIEVVFTNKTKLHCDLLNDFGNKYGIIDENEVDFRDHCYLKKFDVHAVDFDCEQYSTTTASTPTTPTSTTPTTTPTTTTSTTTTTTTTTATTTTTTTTTATTTTTTMRILFKKKMLILN